jgi:hypothetical protein
VGRTLSSCSEGRTFRSRSGDYLPLLKDFVFSSAHQTNATILPKSMPRPLSSKSSPVHYELLTASINKPRLIFNFFFNLCGESLDTAAATGLFYQPRMIGDGDCGEIGGMKIGMGNRSTRRKPAPRPRHSSGG